MNNQLKNLLLISETKRLCVAIFLIISAIIIFCLMTFKNSYLYVPYFHTKYKTFCVSIDLPSEYKDNVEILINDRDFNKNPDRHKIKIEKQIFEESENNLNSIGIEYFFPVKDFKIKISGTNTEVKKTIENIQSVIIFIGNKMYAFNNSDILKFERTKESGSTILYPIKKTDKIFNNYEHPLLSNFAVSFFTIFIHWSDYIIPWILIICGIILLPRSKINSNIIFLFILLLAYLLRVNMQTAYPACIDELTTISDTGGNFIDGIKGWFMDNGNPPLISILNQCLTKFSYDTIFIRTPFILIGTLGTIFVYLLAKNRISEKVGLLSSFIYAISLFSISVSQLARSYIISFAFAPVFVYFLFRAFDEGKLKYYFGLTATGIVLINNHLYGTIFLLLNFVYILYYMAVNKDFSKLKFFTVCFSIMGLTFVPYFITMINNGLFSSDFQSWIAPGNFVASVTYTYGSFALFVLLDLIAIITAIFNKKLFPYFTKKQSDFLLYLIIFIFSFHCIISLISLWKHIICAQYFSIFWGFVIILVSTLIEMKYKFIWIFVLFFMKLQAEIYPFWIHTFSCYENFDKITAFYSQKHKLCINFYKLNVQKDITTQANYINFYCDEIYSLWNNYDETPLEPILDRFEKANADTAFFIQAECLHNIDRENFINNKNNKYYVSLIKTPDSYVIALKPKFRK